MLSSFRKTGLILYDPYYVLSRLREQYEQHTPPLATPQGGNQSEWHTPYTTRALQRQGKYLSSIKLSPTVRRCLDSFLKGSVTQALVSAQAAEDLSYQQAAQNTRRRRTEASRKHVQKGGVLSARNARQITQKRVVDELAAAQLSLDNA